MEKGTHLGMNRTGIAASPLAQELEDMPDVGEAASPESGTAAIAAHELDYLHEADPVGSVPIPKKVKGAAKAALGKLAGKNPEVLINKLGQRLAFERGGARLYDSLIMRCEAADADCPVPIEELRRFREEEAQHFGLLSETMRTLGADPTAQTPDADASGVAAMGVQKVVSDPRMSIAQALDAMLTAELTDNAGWEMLIELARDYGLDDVAKRFDKALQQEAKHLESIRQWCMELTSEQAGVAAS